MNNETDFFDNIDDINEIGEPVPSNQIDELPNDNNYDFVTGDLDDYITDLQEPKEDMGIEQVPTDEEFAEVKRPLIPKKVARNTGRFISKMIDRGASTGLAILAGDEREKHKAEADELKEIEDIITIMVQDNGGEMPLWLQLIIALFTIYGIQLYPAWQSFQHRQHERR